MIEEVESLKGSVVEAIDVVAHSKIAKYVFQQKEQALLKLRRLEEMVEVAALPFDARTTQQVMATYQADNGTAVVNGRTLELAP
ncbi:hypothetical protein GOP47_0030705, partial [Adiantum capillus-veneris]